MKKLCMQCGVEWAEDDSRCPMCGFLTCRRCMPGRTCSHCLSRADVRERLGVEETEDLI